MFEINVHLTPESAVKDMWNYLRTFTWTVFDSQSMFNVVHAVSREEYIAEVTNFYDFHENLLDLLRDLDSQEGVYCDTDEGTNFDESGPAQDLMYRELKDSEHKFGLAGEGLLVLKNVFVSAPGEYPFIVLKPSLFSFQNDFILQSLKNSIPGEDYTAKISPGIYVQLGER